MECPECHKGQLKVINTYQSGDRAKFQRVQCDTCRAIGTVQQILVNTNPVHGQGASALAKKAEKGVSTISAKEEGDEKIT